MAAVIWIGYTTLYREGGPKFERAAQTLAREKAMAHPECSVRCEAIESKRDFVDAMARVAEAGLELVELHFIGHSGMYGPMFRTTEMPEQFSPHEWRSLKLPFAPGGEAFFHACRTARWFAPFFARTFGVPAHGYHHYTSVSLRPDRFVWEARRSGPNAPLYIVACAGKKSHGSFATLAKYAGATPVETMKRFLPSERDGDASYNAVANAYASVFTDIGVRRDEWEWLLPRVQRMQTCFPRGLRVLDVGCGNGALLSKLAGHLREGIGVDASASMIELASTRAGSEGNAHLRFKVLDGPRIDLPDQSIDLIVSLLSFRYLDWDPIMNEFRRVLAPGGRILIVDMVTLPCRWYEWPAVASDKLRQMHTHAQNPEFAQRLKSLTRMPEWSTLLKYNPIRAEHEYRWYLESRFPDRRVETLNRGWRNRMLAFDSGPLRPGWVAPQSYP
jgi:ubiquinone/menaquinone biosynthesis C-methylase UbiE